MNILRYVLGQNCEYAFCFEIGAVILWSLITSICTKRVLIGSTDSMLTSLSYSNRNISIFIFLIRISAGE